MARTELPNGVILPAEYSDDWYEDMTSNLTKLDDVIGSDSEKLNSNDVAFLRMSSAALTDGGTGNFSDLNSSNKLKTGDYVLDSGRKLYQVVSVDSTDETFTVGNSLFKITAESDLAPVAESGDYDDLDNKPDLNPYDQHIANTDIHVTTADKTKWNNGVSQSYVFRYSGTAVVPNSTIAYSTIDNTDNIKSGDKILDVDGKLFEITAVDTTNQTVTVGSALIDLALDANVVHTSGNETVGGQKTFTGEITNNIINRANAYITLKNSSYDPKINGQSNANSSAFSINFTTLTDDAFAYITAYGLPEYSLLRLTTTYFTDSQNSITDSIEYKIYPNGDRTLRPRNQDNCTLGETGRRWKSVYATNYYYGSNNVEFSTKFVTTDTNQTIVGKKTFSDDLLIYNNDSSQNTKNLNISSSKIQVGDTSNSDAFGIRFNAGPSYVAQILAVNDTSGTQNLQFSVRTKDSLNNFINSTIRLRTFANGNSSFEPGADNTVSLGSSSFKFKDVQTYQINGLTPSSLSLPDLTNAVDISGYITDLTGSPNVYSPPANGYIVLRSTTANVLGIVENTTGMGSYSRGSNQVLAVNLPVVKNSSISIYAICSSLTHAKFIPCQGNI